MSKRRAKGESEVTLQEIADCLGLSKNAVAELEKRALNKLRAHFNLLELGSCAYTPVRKDNRVARKR